MTLSAPHTHHYLKPLKKTLYLLCT